MITIVDAALVLFPTIVPTLFVDDLSLERDGEAPSILDNLCGFALDVMKRIGEDGMEVNRTKSLISASHPTLADDMAARMGSLALTISHRVKSLGGGTCSWHSSQHHGAECTAQEFPEEATEVPHAPTSGG